MNFTTHLDELKKQSSIIDQKGIYPKEWLKNFGSTYNGFDIQNHYNNNNLYSLLSKQAEVSKICVNTSFCVWCHSACIWYLIHSDNTFLQNHFLPKLQSGKLLGGTGLSNAMKTLSSLDDIRVHAAITSDGYILNGALPWVSNISKNSVFAIVFKVNNELKMGLIDTTQEGITSSEVSSFIGLNGSKTVNVQFNNYILKNTMLISDDAYEFLHKIKSGFIVLQTQMALGIIASIIDLIKYKINTKPWLTHTLPISLEDITDRYKQLHHDIALICGDFKSHNQALFKKVVDVRLYASILSLDASRSLSLAYGASGYLKQSIAHKKNREAQFISIVTPSITHLALMQKDLQQIK